MKRYTMKFNEIKNFVGRFFSRVKNFIKKWTKLQTWQDSMLPENPAEHQRLIRFLFFIVGVTAALMLLILLLSFFVLNISVPRVRVPAMTRMDMIDAVRLAQAQKLIPTFEMRFSEADDRFQVIKQYPAHGVSVREGRKVTLVVSMGKDLYIVPDLSNMQKNQAIEILEAERIPYEIVIVPASEHNTNMVIAQSAPARTKLPRSEALTLMVTDEVKEGQYLLDDFVRQPVEYVVSRLYYNGIIPIVVSTNVPSLSDDGLVLEQNVEAGTILAKNSSVILNVGLFANDQGEYEKLRWYVFRYRFPGIERPESGIDEPQDVPQTAAKFYKIVVEDELGRPNVIYERAGVEGTVLIKVFKAYGNAKIYIYANNEIIGSRDYGAN